MIQLRKLGELDVRNGAVAALVNLFEGGDRVVWLDADIMVRPTRGSEICTHTHTPCAHFQQHAAEQYIAYVVSIHIARWSKSQGECSLLTGEA